MFLGVDGSDRGMWSTPSFHHIDGKNTQNSIKNPIFQKY